MIGAVACVAVRMGKRPSEVMEWTAPEIALCLAFMKRDNPQM